MKLVFLGSGGSDSGGCPTLYTTERGTYLAQGWITDTPGTIEIPHLLLGFLEPDTFIGATMTDTGRGTFLVSGKSVTDAEALAQMDIYPGETAIEVPKQERHPRRLECQAIAFSPR
ncbi:hypothetical protein OHA40_08670 [Nocardia sp. NBC_00508]|uniref:hypothetical protein n=1 Tax=Nocardia sp. NBC_00508 TaxID=2975992 RepID=UPI002E7FC533|nr:hypothetical protein [Nocardia sp. NBC_00508]WUD68174.1 hypothetical protein OHA40_08670 [Nocardia sp. NBC_00508]